MHPHIKLVSNELVKNIQSVIGHNEWYCPDLQKKLLELTSKLINNNFKDDNEKIEIMKQQAYIAGKLEEANKMMEVINNIGSKVNQLNGLIEYQIKEEEKKESK
jgi:hypothetical protein